MELAEASESLLDRRLSIFANKNLLFTLALTYRYDTIAMKPKQEKRIMNNKESLSVDVGA
jgi:hypothetical protein